MSHLPNDRYVRRPTTIPRADTGARLAPSYVVRRPAPRRTFGRFLGLTALGAVLPGSGLLLAGKRKSGGTLLTLVVLAVVAAAAYLWVRGPRLGALALALDPTFLLAATIGAILAAIVVLASIVWTGVITWPHPSGAGLNTLSTLCVLALCVVVAAPTALGVRDVSVHRDLLQTLFNQPGFLRSGVSPDVNQADPWSNHPRVNVMLVGADSQDNRVGLRTDSMMLASIDTQTGDTVLFGLPRNLEGVPFPTYSPLHTLWPQGFRCAEACLLNDVWMQGVDHKDLYPGDPQPGLTALNEAVTGVTGLTPDYGVVVNMRSFMALVDAMGGVDISVRDRVPIGGKVENGRIVPGSIRGWIEPGAQHLDGYHAMWFSRGRATTDDFDRMRRQRCMVGALVKQINTAMMLERYPAIAQVAKDNIYTNIPQQHLAAWAGLADRMQRGTIRSLPFSDKVVNVGNPDFALIQQKVTEAIAGGPTPSPTTSPTGTTGSTSTPTPARTSPQGSGTGSPSATPDGLVDVANAC